MKKLLLGFKTINSSASEWATVSHQRCDVLLEGNSEEEMTEEYNRLVQVGKENAKKLSNLNDSIEHSSMTEEEYERKWNKLSSSIQILKYDSIIIVDGVKLK